MELKRAQQGMTHWSAPWNAGWSAMVTQREVRTRQHALPANSERRIRRVGWVASSLAVVIWCTGIAWLWPVVA